MQKVATIAFDYSIASTQGPPPLPTTQFAYFRSAVFVGGGIEAVVEVGNVDAGRRSRRIFVSWDADLVVASAFLVTATDDVDVKATGCRNKMNG